MSIKLINKNITGSDNNSWLRHLNLQAIEFDWKTIASLFPHYQDESNAELNMVNNLIYKFIVTGSYFCDDKHIIWRKCKS